MTKIPNFENSRWRTAAIKNFFFAISQPRIIRFQRNLVCRCKFWFQ